MKYNNNKEALERLREDVESFLGVAEIDTKDRRQGLCEARFMFYKIARDRKYSLYSIGWAVNRNHATIIHGLKVHEDYMEYHKQYKILYEHLLSHIRAEYNNNLYIGELIKKTSHLNKFELKHIIDNLINPYVDSLERDVVTNQHC